MSGMPPIDKVILKADGLAIADVKTNTTLNKVCELAISICKYLFGLVNPKLKDRGAVYHTRKGRYGATCRGKSTCRRCTEVARK